MVSQKGLKLWAAWFLGLVLLIGGVAFVVYHIEDIPNTWNFVGFGAILGLIGFITMIGTTTWIRDAD